jgi:nucleotide-binding universal stress UspA family protein
MTFSTLLPFVLLAWIGLGAVQALFLGRRGFDGLSWFLIGVVLGPLSVLVAWNCVRRDERLQPRTLRDGVPGRGPTDVLIGFDGSPESRAAIRAVEDTVGAQLGRVALATVLHFDDPPEDEHRRVAALEAVGAPIAGVLPELIVVRGHPATALADAARVGNFDVLAIGSTGDGHAHVFGSAAKELVQRCTVPVLVAGQQVTSRDDRRSIDAIAT